MNMLISILNNGPKYIDHSVQKVKNCLTTTFIIFKKIILEGTTVFIELSKYSFYSLKRRMTKNPAFQTKAEECWRKMLKAKHYFDFSLNDQDISDYFNAEFPKVMKEQAVKFQQKKSEDERKEADNKA